MGGLLLYVSTHVHVVRAKRSFLSSIPLFLTYCFVFLPLQSVGRKRGKNVFYECIEILFVGMEILMGLVFDLWPVKYPKSSFMYSRYPIVGLWFKLFSLGLLCCSCCISWMLCKMESGSQTSDLPSL